MTRTEAVEKLRTSCVFIEFQKSDGSSRVMHATLQPDFIIEKPTGKSRKENEDRVAVWDLDLSQWHSFRFGRLRLFDNVSLPKGL